jgi:FHA domain
MNQPAADPYSTYLCLTTGSRPPNFYELLELELFCSHHERINQAVKKQFRRIKNYHDQHDRNTRETIQDIINTIATARVVLTDPVQKDQYDQQLANKLGIDRRAHLAAMIAAPLPEFKVTVIAGPTLVEHRFELVEGTTCQVGSSAHCQISIQPARSTPNHCTIEFHDGDWFVTATDPQHPITVNNQPTTEYVLANGDQIDVGGYRLRFQDIKNTTPTTKPRPPQAPPISLIVQKGPTIPAPIFNTLSPQRITVGSGDAALWQLADQAVSRLHCAVQSVGDRWEIEDLNSTNGTIVNGVEVMRHLISDRDIITLGNFDILASIRF